MTLEEARQFIESALARGMTPFVESTLKSITIEVRKGDIMIDVTNGHKLYVICVRDTSYYLIGPFTSYAAVNVWVDEEEKQSGDPRWQAIELKDKPGNLLPMLRGPDAHIPSDSPY